MIKLFVILTFFLPLSVNFHMKNISFHLSRIQSSKSRECLVTNSFITETFMSVCHALGTGPDIGCGLAEEDSNLSAEPGRRTWQVLDRCHQFIICYTLLCVKGFWPIRDSSW